MRISSELYAQMIEQARAEAPNECCGMIGTRDGEAVSVYPTANAAETPKYRFVIDGQEQYNVWRKIEEESELGAIYHSHPRTAPEPSLTDIRYAEGWPGVIWIIIGYAESDPEVRAWQIEGDEATETKLEIAG